MYRLYGSAEDSRSSAQISDLEKEENKITLDLVYSLMEFYKCSKGIELVDEVKNSYNNSSVRNWLSLRNLRFGFEKDGSEFNHCENMYTFEELQELSEPLCIYKYDHAN